MNRSKNLNRYLAMVSLCLITLLVVLDASAVTQDLEAEIRSLEGSENLYQGQLEQRKTTFEMLRSRGTDPTVLANAESKIQETKTNLEKIQQKLAIKSKMLEGIRSSKLSGTCTPDTPEIDLEAGQGPFAGLPVDFQGQLGVCYANTTKNLMVSLSRGKMNPSFLDIAVQSKDEKSVLAQGLDGGGVCPVLEKLRKVGLCAQSKAKRETIQSQMNEELLVDIMNLRRLGQLVSQFPTEAKKLDLNNFKLTSHFQFPINDQDWKKAFALAGQQAQFAFAREQLFTEEWKVRVKFLDELFSQTKTIEPDKLCQTYVEQLSPVFSKLNLPIKPIGEALCKGIAPNHLLNDLAEAKLRHESFFESMLHYQLGETTRANPQLGVEKLFRTALTKGPQQLVLEAFASECIQERQQFSSPYYCEDDFLKRARTKFSASALNDKVRERMLLHLSQGYAVGRASYGHLHTIVGHRYNKSSKRCEFKIRESQLGRSIWNDEASIIRDMQTLIEVR